MSKNNEQRDLIFEIKNYEKFNFKIIRNIKKFRCKIHATYLTWFTIFNYDITWVKMTEFYHHNIECATKIKKIWKQYLHYETILKLWENKRVNVKYQITSC